MAAELSAAVTGALWMGAARELAQAQSTGPQLVTPEDEQWPARLSAPLPASSRTDRTAPPLGLWVYGEGRLHELLSRVAIITGTPWATPYGVSAAFDLARDISGVGWTVLGYGRAGIASAVLAVRRRFRTGRRRAAGPDERLATARTAHASGPRTAHWGADRAARPPGVRGGRPGRAAGGCRRCRGGAGRAAQQRYRSGDRSLRLSTGRQCSPCPARSATGAVLRPPPHPQRKGATDHWRA